MSDLHDLRCNRCGGALDGPAERLAGTRHDAFACRSCGSRFDVLDGVPFIGAFDAEHFVGLIGMTATRPGPNPPDARTLRHRHGLLADDDAAIDRDAFRARLTEPERIFLGRRRPEWLERKALVAGVPLRGARLLDVGAGTGFDALGHAMDGASVTALDVAPRKLALGHRTLPELRWVGGVAHALPFTDASFDVVTANAALHHMHDLPAAFSEMLRVLRPGGWLVTTADSFAPDHATADHDVPIFERHAAVLAGVDERVPRLDEFLQTLLRHRGDLSIELFTSMLYGAPGPDGPIDLDGIRAWDLERDQAMLRERSGSLALRVQVLRPLRIAQRFQRSPLVPARRELEWIADPAAEARDLAALAPPDLVDRPLLGAPHDKLELLFGWRPEIADAGFREAHRRGRWILTRPPEATRLSFRARLATAASATRSSALAVLLDGIELARHPLDGATWRFVAVDLTSVPAERPFMVELRLVDPGTRFEDGLFHVAERKVAAPSWGGRLGRIVSSARI